jgi:hypothetical protein
LVVYKDTLGVHNGTLSGIGVKGARIEVDFWQTDAWPVMRPQSTPEFPQQIFLVIHSLVAGDVHEKSDAQLRTTLHSLGQGLKDAPSIKKSVSSD